jgi:hypothetical protein
MLDTTMIEKHLKREPISRARIELPTTASSARNREEMTNYPDMIAYKSSLYALEVQSKKFLVLMERGDNETNATMAASFASVNTSV